MEDGYNSTWDSGQYYRDGKLSRDGALTRLDNIRIWLGLRDKYDVFIHYRGLDKTFVAHLTATLRIRGFRPFLGMTESFILPVSIEVYRALGGAPVHVVIFSKGYAESEYCLDELCIMLESEVRIIPVFYDIKTNDMRKIEDGPYKEAFVKHQKRERIERIIIWKEALRKVADCKGFGMDEVNG